VHASAFGQALLQRKPALVSKKHRPREKIPSIFDHIQSFASEIVSAIFACCGSLACPRPPVGGGINPGRHLDIS
jgi:hypothetical protein